eukprot:4935494-Pleurochrysis_carterae.AAC.1
MPCLCELLAPIEPMHCCARRWSSPFSVTTASPRCCSTCLSDLSSRAAPASTGKSDSSSSRTTHPRRSGTASERSRGPANSTHTRLATRKVSRARSHRRSRMANRKRSHRRSLKRSHRRSRKPSHMASYMASPMRSLAANRIARARGAHQRRTGAGRQVCNTAVAADDGAACLVSTIY